MIDLFVYDRYLANDDDLSPELTQELLDAYRALQRENVQIKARLAEKEAGNEKMETGVLPVAGKGGLVVGYPASGEVWKGEKHETLSVMKWTKRAE
nr:hypothetical protein [Nitrosomonas nitrosa]